MAWKERRSFGFVCPKGDMHHCMALLVGVGSLSDEVTETERDFFQADDLNSFVLLPGLVTLTRCMNAFSFDSCILQDLICPNCYSVVF